MKSSFTTALSQTPKAAKFGVRSSQTHFLVTLRENDNDSHKTSRGQSNGEKKRGQISVVRTMPRISRVAPGGMIYHVLNRGVGRQRLLSKASDFAAFEAVIEETLEKTLMRICGYCVMPNHWHFVLRPERDGDLATFMQRLTVTHVTRWQKLRRKIGEGHVYQGRFKLFPVETDDFFYHVLRYVERNALRANLVPRTEDWQWSSLWRREHGTPEQRRCLSTWPLPRPRAWLQFVYEAETELELDALRRRVKRGRPYGSDQ